MTRSERNFSWSLSTALLLILLLAMPHFAFGDNVYASIRGLVTDPSGASVPSARITATNTDTGIATTINSSPDGNYVFPQLQIGTYEVSARLSAFKRSF